MGRLNLLFRRTLEDLLSNSRLPLEPVLPINLGRNGERLALLQQAGTDDDLGAEDGLVVIYVRGAVGAVVAIDWFAWGPVKMICQLML